MEITDNSSESAASKCMRFLELVGLLKHMKRKGWVIRDVNDPECIASHMYRMAVMSFLIEPTSSVNRLRCMELAIVHDLPECIVGDITPLCGISIAEKHERENEAMKQITSLMPTNSEYVRELYEEYQSQSTAEAKMVKEFDRLDMIIQAFQYEKLEGPSSPRRLEEFFTSTEGKFFTPFIRAIQEELVSQRTSIHEK